MSSRRRLVRKESQAQLAQKMRQRCPRCGKICADSEEQAWSLARRQNARRGGEMPQRVYSCNDDGQAPFHWTRQATRFERTHEHPDYAQILAEEYGDPGAVEPKPVVHVPTEFYSEDYWL